MLRSSLLYILLLGLACSSGQRVHSKRRQQSGFQKPAFVPFTTRTTPTTQQPASVEVEQVEVRSEEYQELQTPFQPNQGFQQQNNFQPNNFQQNSFHQPNSLEKSGFQEQNFQQRPEQRQSFRQDSKVQPKEHTTPIPIIRLEKQQSLDGSYKSNYETGNSIQAEETGFLKNIGNPEQEALVQFGSYSYTDPDGQLVSVSYTADEGGFRATGSHIPTPPPIPPEVQKGLDIIYESIRQEAERAAKERKLKNSKLEAENYPVDGQFQNQQAPRQVTNQSRAPVRQ